VHAMEWLRHLASATGMTGRDERVVSEPDDVARACSFAAESLIALCDLASEAERFAAMRLLLRRTAECGPLWWAAARLASAPDPDAELYSTLEALDAAEAWWRSAVAAMGHLDVITAPSVGTRVLSRRPDQGEPSGQSPGETSFRLLWSGLIGIGGYSCVADAEQGDEDRHASGPVAVVGGPCIALPPALCPVPRQESLSSSGKPRTKMAFGSYAAAGLAAHDEPVRRPSWHAWLPDDAVLMPAGDEALAAGTDLLAGSVAPGLLAGSVVPGSVAAMGLQASNPEVACRRLVSGCPDPAELTALRSPAS